MDDAMYDMQTGSQDDGAGHEPVKRKPVRPAELRLDDSKENLGLERVDYGYLSPYLETQETPADRVARRLIATPSMHSHRDNPNGGASRSATSAGSRRRRPPHDGLGHARSTAERSNSPPSRSRSVTATRTSGASPSATTPPTNRPPNRTSRQPITPHSTPDIDREYGRALQGDASGGRVPLPG